VTNSDLRERALRLIELEEKAEDAKLDLKAAYDAAASAGYTKAALKSAIKLHRMDADKRAKHDSAQMDIEMYLAEIEGRRLTPKDLTDTTTAVVAKIVDDALAE
jgi:uncharacterized protein (UPF0335 family)